MITSNRNVINYITTRAVIMITLRLHFDYFYLFSELKRKKEKESFFFKYRKSLCKTINKVIAYSKYLQTE